jgi:hypothetical protein
LIVALLISLVILLSQIFPYTPPAAQDFTVQLSIRLAIINQTNPNNPYIRAIVPPTIGIPGAQIWASTQYSYDGISGYYPVYTQMSPNPYPGYTMVHVRSRSNHNYTLGDFFAVWNEKLGENNTLGYTTPPSSSQSSSFGSGWFWEMCVKQSGGTLLGVASNWGGQVLRPGMVVILDYSDIGCA